MEDLRINQINQNQNLNMRQSSSRMDGQEQKTLKSDFVTDRPTDGRTGRRTKKWPIEMRIREKNMGS